MTSTLQLAMVMMRFNIFLHVWSYLHVFLAHKEQVWFVVLHTWAEWTVVQQYVTPCLLVLIYFEITDTQSRREREGEREWCVFVCSRQGREQGIF